MTIVLTGKNTHVISKRIAEIIASFVNEKNGSIERFEGSEMTSSDSVIDAVRSISFLDPNKLVIVKNFGQCLDLMSRIEYVIEQVADTTKLVLVDQHLDKRTTSYKNLNTIAEVEDIGELNTFDLERWVQTKAKEHDASIDSKVSRILVDRVGPNQQMLGRELEKLALNSSQITEDSVYELIEKSPQSKIFDLLDVLFRGDGEKAWELYSEQIARGEDPHKILAMITWQLQQIVLAVFAPVKDKKTLTDAGMSPYSAQKCLDISRDLSKEQVRGFVQRLANIDYLTKTSADVTSALETYFSEITLSIATS